MNTEHSRVATSRVAPISEDDLSLADFFGILRDGWLLIAFVAITCVTVSLLYAFLATPIYRAEVLLAPMAEDSSATLDKLAGAFGGIAELAGVSLGGSGSSKDEAIALLQSRVLARQFISDEQLMPLLFADQWDADRGAWRSADPDEVPTIGDAFRLWDETIRRVETSTSSALVTLAIEWKDPELAARWATEFVRRANELMRARAIAEAQKSIDYLNAELGKTSVVDVQLAIHRLIESQIKTMTLARVREEYYFSVLDPAVVADSDDFVRPQRVSIVIAGFVGGILLGLLVVITRNAMRHGRSVPSG